MKLSKLFTFDNRRWYVATTPTFTAPNFFGTLCDFNTHQFVDTFKIHCEISARAKKTFYLRRATQGDEAFTWTTGNATRVAVALLNSDDLQFSRDFLRTVRPHVPYRVSQSYTLYANLFYDLHFEVAASSTSNE